MSETGAVSGATELFLSQDLSTSAKVRIEDSLSVGGSIHAAKGLEIDGAGAAPAEDSSPLHHASFNVDSGGLGVGGRGMFGGGIRVGSRGTHLGRGGDLVGAGEIAGVTVGFKFERERNKATSIRVSERRAVESRCSALPRSPALICCAPFPGCALLWLCSCSALALLLLCSALCSALLCLAQSSIGSTLAPAHHRRAPPHTLNRGSQHGTSLLQAWKTRRPLRLEPPLWPTEDSASPEASTLGQILSSPTQPRLPAPPARLSSSWASSRCTGPSLSGRGLL